MYNERLATIGMFDGVHKGHLYLLRQALDEARRLGLESMVVTFSEHPRTMLKGSPEKLLTTCDERRTRLEATGIDRVCILDFSQIHTLTAEQFLRYLHEKESVTTLLMGYDHHFGSDRLSSIEDYKRAGQRAGVQILHALPYTETTTNNEPYISSSLIRKALEDGRIEHANDMLGYAYSVSGQVVHGKQIGTKIGFPTANLQLAEANKLIPQKGVYAVQVELNKRIYRGVMNIGDNPTIECTPSQTSHLEVHIIGFEGNLYDQSLRVEFIHRLRDEVQFASLAALRAQIATDIQHATEF